MSTAKKKRASWTQSDLEAAVTAVRLNKLSSYKAASSYNIPRRTLRDYLKSGMSKLNLGRRSIFTSQQEQDFVKRIIRFADLGIPLTAKIIRKQAFVFCETYNIANNFNKQLGIAGRDWLKLFLKRNSNVAKRKAQFLNQARGQKLNKAIVSHHFKEVEKLYDELGIRYNPERLYNMDEKGCRLTMHKQPTVIAQKGTKRVHLQASEHGENVTIVGCANALGNSIPPMIIFKGVRRKPEFELNLPPGSIVRMAPKGSMTTELFIDFLRHFARYKTSGNCLLIFDGAKCHLDYRIAEEADILGITLYCLPSNTTHELQPLDKACYKPFESYWDQEVLQHFYKTHALKLTRPDFNRILSRIWSKCMTHENITSGFRATGLYPLNPNVLPESAFAPSVLTEQQAPLVEDRSESCDIRVSPMAVTNEDLESLMNVGLTTPTTAYLTHEVSPSLIESLNTFDIEFSHLQVTPPRSLIECRSPHVTPPRSTVVWPAPEHTPQRSHMSPTPTVILPDSHIKPHSLQLTPSHKKGQPCYRSPVASTSGLQTVKRLVCYSSSTDASESEHVSDSEMNTKFITRPLIQRCPHASDDEDSSDSKIMTKFIKRSRLEQSLRIYSSDSGSEANHEDDVPLAQLSQKSQFELLMPTPNYEITKKRPRRKALNYKGQRVNKDLFNDPKDVKKKADKSEVARLAKGKTKPKEMKKKSDDNETANKRKLKDYNIKTKENIAQTKERKKGISKKKGKENKSGEWYCYACYEDRIADMRSCLNCTKWYHEECIGLTKNDIEEFRCPDGCDL